MNYCDNNETIANKLLEVLVDGKYAIDFKVQHRLKKTP